MSFIVLKESILPIELSFQGFGYTGWVTGNNYFYLINFSKWLILRIQGKLDMRDVLARSKGEGGGMLNFTLQ